MINFISCTPPDTIKIVKSSTKEWMESVAGIRIVENVVVKPQDKIALRRLTF
jgi:hypothetical protein